MYKSLALVAAALAISSLALVSAQAGGATSAPSKYSHTADSVNTPPAPRYVAAQSADVRITEFSSSSAKTSVPKR
jgi:hypothetical protein